MMASTWLRRSSRCVALSRSLYVGHPTPGVCRALCTAAPKPRSPLNRNRAAAASKAGGISKKLLFRAGVPFIAFMLFGYYGLAAFVESKVERADVYVKKQSEREFDMEEQRREMIAKLNIDDYVIKPVPRPKNEDIY